MTQKVVVTDIHCFFFFLVTVPLQLNPVVVFKILDVLVVSA